MRNGEKYAHYMQYYPKFLEEEIINRYEAKEFLIISIARISFPHKGYLIGLVENFAILKKKYPNVRLRIIGDGPDRQKLNEVINTLSLDVKNSIELVGSVFFSELENYCRDANLNISLAGGVLSASMYGVPTLVVRHSGSLFTCETYGFLPKSKDKTVCVDPGEPVLPFIEKVINMTKEQYLDLSRASYKAYFRSNEIVDENYFAQMNNLNVDPHKLSPFFMRLLLKISFRFAKMIKFRPNIKL